VALRIGKSSKWVAVRIQIASMAEAILNLVRKDKIGIAHVQALAMVKDPEIRLELASAASGGEWTVSQLREAIEEHQRKLADAPWKMNEKFSDATGKIQPCLGCHERSDKQGDLFGGEKNALCLDGKCWIRKLEAFKAILKAKDEAEGRKLCERYDEQAVEDGWRGYTKDGCQIKELKDAGVKPRLLIKADGSTVDCWNTNDMTKDEGDEDNSTSSDGRQGRVESPELKAKIEADRKKWDIDKIYNNLIDGIIAEKLVTKPEQTFIEYLADAIVDESGYYGPLYKLAGEYEEGHENEGDVKPIRGSGHSLEQIKQAMCKWLVTKIKFTESDIGSFGINPKIIRKKAEKQYEDDQKQEA